MPGTLTIDKAETIARVTASSEPSIVGSPVTFRVAVSRTDFQYPGVPDGAVTLSEGGVTLAQGTLADGVATLTLSSLPAGTHAIEVHYAGSTNYPPVHARRAARGADRSAGGDALAAVGRLHHDRSSACRRDQSRRRASSISWYPEDGQP